MNDESSGPQQLDPDRIVQTIVEDARRLNTVVTRLIQTDTLFELTDETTVTSQTRHNYSELEKLLGNARAHFEELTSPCVLDQGAQLKNESEPPYEPEEVCPETVISAPVSTTEPEAAPSPTPAAMVGTAPPKTPRPPRIHDTMTMSEGAERMVVSHQISLVGLQQVIDQPDNFWLGENPLSVDKPTVAVRSDQEWGVIYYLIGEDAKFPHVISVKRCEVLFRERKSLTVGHRKAGAGASNDRPKRSTIDSLDGFVKRAQEAGLEYTPGKKHGKINKPGVGHTVTIPNTPSDTRSWNNAVSTVKRLLGVEL